MRTCYRPPTSLTPSSSRSVQKSAAPCPRRRRTQASWGSCQCVGAYTIVCLNQNKNEKESLCFFFSFRSSYTCSYFVLPCCQHDFNRRFSGKAKGKSQYQTYLMYVAQVGQACGFEVEEDTLRIPSTKRVSIHGDPSFSHFFSFSFCLYCNLQPSDKHAEKSHGQNY